MELSAKELAIANTLVSVTPGLVTSEESVTTLAMGGCISFSAGQDLISSMESDKPLSPEVPSNLTYPDGIEQSIISTVVSNSSKEDQDAFLKAIDAANAEFVKMFKKSKNELERVTRRIVEITGSDSEVASQIEKSVMGGNIKVIK